MNLNSKSISKIEKIEKGWSLDEKYYVEDEHLGKLLLRISEHTSYDRKQQEFTLMKLVGLQEVRMSTPLKFWREEDKLYALYTWCDGDELGEVVSDFNDALQYKLGYIAGDYLYKIHSVPINKKLDWKRVYGKKAKKKIEMYRMYNIPFEGAEDFIGYIEKNFDLLEHRDTSFLHGDYHVGNMIVSSDNNLSIIDFDRFDYGDPWEDFNRIVWSAQRCPAFACGQIHGYFKQEPPELFFKLLAFYMAVNAIGAIPWAVAFGDVQVLLKQAHDVLMWYNHMNTIIPSWYQKIEDFQ